jgi:hypothetical protein
MYAQRTRLDDYSSPRLREQFLIAYDLSCPTDQGDQNVECSSTESDALAILEE